MMQTVLALFSGPGATQGAKPDLAPLTAEGGFHLAIDGDAGAPLPAAEDPAPATGLTPDAAIAAALWALVPGKAPAIADRGLTPDLADTLPVADDAAAPDSADFGLVRQAAATVDGLDPATPPALGQTALLSSAVSDPAVDSPKVGPVQPHPATSAGPDTPARPAPQVDGSGLHPKRRDPGAVDGTVVGPRRLVPIFDAPNFGAPAAPPTAEDLPPVRDAEPPRPGSGASRPETATPVATVAPGPVAGAGLAERPDRVVDLRPTAGMPHLAPQAPGFADDSAVPVVVPPPDQREDPPVARWGDQPVIENPGAVRLESVRRISLWEAAFPANPPSDPDPKSPVDAPPRSSAGPDLAAFAAAGAKPAPVQPALVQPAPPTNAPTKAEVDLSPPPPPGTGPDLKPSVPRTTPVPTAPHGQIAPVATASALLTEAGTDIGANTPSDALLSAPFGQQAAALPPTVTPTVAAGGPAVQHLSAQIVAGLVSPKPGVTEISLSPEELGRVKLRLQSDAQNPDRMVVMLSFDRPETMDLFRRHADQLAEIIRSAGYSGVDISFAQQGQGDQGQAGDRQPGPRTGAVETPSPALPASTPPAPRPLRPGHGLDLRM
jgi:hypothetical protein